MDLYKRTIKNENRVYLTRTVFDQAIERIDWVFNEFNNRVCVNCSGGKDSTVVLELALLVGKRRGIERLPVMWLDQECEFQSTVDYMTDVMTRPTVDPCWLQVPFRLFNATSIHDEWLHVWGEGEEWVRPKHDISIKENVYGTDRFRDLLSAAHDYHHLGYAVLTGMRAEESAVRFNVMTHPSYKWITWASKANKHTLFHPIYDWGWRDVWKAIDSNKWAYNRHYDALYRMGVDIQKMRVSNYHHETAVHSLFILQEIEPDSYARATKRLSGIATAAKLGADDFFIRDLPFMFQSWEEYRDYLLDKLIADNKREIFVKQFAAMDRALKERNVDDPKEINKWVRRQIQCIVTNDFELTKSHNALVEIGRIYKKPTNV